MKKNAACLLLILGTALHLFASVTPVAFDADGERKNYGETLTITPMDKTVTVTKDKIVIAPKKERVEYTITGYFNGQIVNKTKNTVLKLKNAYLENTSGEPALLGEAKTEIATANGSTNYVLSSGTNAAKVAALHCKKNLELGGSGTLYVSGSVYHAVKGDDVKIKGSGTFYLQGTSKGSALNCRSLIVEAGKACTVYLMNSKNGIKADNTISIASGSFYVYDNGTAFKTDTKEKTPGEAHGITLSGGVFHTHGNAALYATEKNAYKAAGSRFIED